MKMMVNIIKLSSFSIAKMSLGAAGPSPAATKNLQVNEPLLPQSPGSQKSEKPKNSSKPVSFLMEPTGGSESYYKNKLKMDFNLKKLEQPVTVPEYCVSRLPDDIIVNIFSRLSLREAARTSIVSSRWRYLWTFTANLVFVAPKTLLIMKKLKVRKVKEKVSRYVRWVNKVLELHRGPCINEFKIQFDLGDDENSNITNWIYTAFAKGIQKLELNFHPLMGIGSMEYIFPLECYNNLKTLSSIKSSRSLVLDSVQVTREIVEFFIYNCPHLERLRVVSSRCLLSLRIVGSSIQLKYLDIYYCKAIKEIEISAPNLLSFKYSGPQIKLHVENVPLLLDVSIGGTRGVALRNLIDQIICFLPQLETLGLHYLDLTELISDDHGRNYRRRTINQFPGFSHQHLKVVEFIGFVGCPVDLELAFYLLENVTMLEKMIVNTTSPFLMETYSEFYNDEKKQVNGKRAKQLKEKVPQGVELVIC
ncbi:hypothetical protein EZV62_022885 [Acer yangbiense]|uniref:F-box domain-containing protein n=1 Tax=Acer yangbiense TaxID=1000413 RepID=A0A5C7H0L1_9ROSI|nr:hypothetical protein EZV62_022885 [Acer yangbiense]